MPSVVPAAVLILPTSRYFRTGDRGRTQVVFAPLRRTAGFAVPWLHRLIIGSLGEAFRHTGVNRVDARSAAVRGSEVNARRRPWSFNHERFNDCFLLVNRQTSGANGRAAGDLNAAENEHNPRPDVRHL